jgi:hypothetical protein
MKPTIFDEPIEAATADLVEAKRRGENFIELLNNASVDEFSVYLARFLSRPDLKLDERALRKVLRKHILTVMADLAVGMRDHPGEFRKMSDWR